MSIRDNDFSEQGAIDEQASRIFSQALPVNWRTITPRPDIYTDYQIEIRDDNVLTGLTFYVQQKGQKSVQITPKGVRYPGLRTKHLRYWVYKCRRPVFLVVIDVTAGQGYWLFIQQHVLDHVDLSKLEEQDQITIYLPSSQTLEDISALKRAAQHADRYVIGLHPDALPAAMAGQQDRWERLDRRIAVLVEATRDVCRLRLQPRENIEFSLLIRGKPERIDHIYREFLGRGVPVEFKPGEVRVEGSPLLNELFQRGRLIQQCRRIEIDMNVTALDEHGRTSTQLTMRPAVIEAGTEELRLTASLQHAMFMFSGTLRRKDLTLDHVVASFAFRFRFDGWIGQPLTRLAYFDQLKAIFEALVAGMPVTGQCSHLGTSLFHGTMNASGYSQEWAQIASVFSSLAKARELAKRFDVDPVFPAILENCALDSIDELYDDLQFGTRPAPDASVRTTLQRRLLLAACDGDPVGLAKGDLRLEQQSFQVSLLGAVVTVPPILILLTEVAATVPGGNIVDELRKSSDGTIEIEWRATTASVLTIAPFAGKVQGSGEAVGWSKT